MDWYIDGTTNVSSIHDIKSTQISKKKINSFNEILEDHHEYFFMISLLIII